MSALVRKPVFTSKFSDWSEVQLDPGSLYLYATTDEPRTQLPDAWKAAQELRRVDFLSIIAQEAYEIEVNAAGVSRHVPLRAPGQLEGVVEAGGGRTVYLDITGMRTHVWAPLVRASWSRGMTRVLYSEPSEYKERDVPLEGQMFDLSTITRGIEPLPGWVTFSDPPDKQAVCLVAFVGFEGSRFAYVAEQADPLPDKIFPVVGVPGFRPDYPFVAYLANQVVLRREDIWQRVALLPASCPFSSLHYLQEVSKQHPTELLKVAPLGTKPHALGAIMFSLLTTTPCEIIYDHPVVSEGRSTGRGPISIYDLAPLGNRR